MAHMGGGSESRYDSGSFGVREDLSEIVLTGVVRGARVVMQGTSGSGVLCRHEGKRL